MIELPEALAARPRHGVFPIPFVTGSRNGKPDFRSHDRNRRAECARGRLCQLCGTRMGDRFVLVGFVPSLARRRFGEPPAHEECMEAAWAICPWLAHRRTWEEEWGAVSTIVPRPATEPEVMVWATASSYRWQDDNTGMGVWIPGEDLIGTFRWRGRRDTPMSQQGEG